jgi:anti-anti-sigma regulatory factor
MMGSIGAAEEITSSGFTIELSGPVDIKRAEELRLFLLQHRPRAVFFDLTEATTIDREAIDILFHDDLLHAVGREYVLRNARPDIVAILHVLKLLSHVRLERRGRQQVKN